jgi:beta-glucanase (GH16 family)
MLAFWLVGFEEESPAASGEICVVELFGHSIGTRRSTLRIGVKANNDPRRRQDMEDVALDLDATDWHSYAAEWTPERIRFFVDDRPVQLMVDLFEFPEGRRRDPAVYPKVGEVRAVRGYRRA